MKARSDYVLVTPAKNEEKTIGTTIECVLNQTVLPVEWVIVSDGSTDKTDAIVEAAARSVPWLRLLKLPQRVERSFAAVVRATEAGIRSLGTSRYGYIGLLDSDIRFERTYFERLIEEFECSPRLGLAGGVVIDIGTRRDMLPRNRADVPGAVQFFRRSCFEALGGLLPIPEGGWDALTCARARMLGYETRLLVDLVVDHLKPRNVAEGGLLRRTWQLGVRDWALHYHPVFEFCKCAGRLTEAPLLVGAAARMLGYCFAAIQRRPRHIPENLAKFTRDEQLSRLGRMFRPARRSLTPDPRPAGRNGE